MSQKFLAAMAGAISTLILPTLAPAQSNYQGPNVSGGGTTQRGSGLNPSPAPAQPSQPTTTQPNYSVNPSSGAAPGPPPNSGPPPSPGVPHYYVPLQRPVGR